MDNLFIRELWVYQRRGRLRGQSRRRRQRVWAATKFTSTPRWTTWRLCLLLEDDNIVPKVEKGRFSILKCNSLSASCGHYQGCLSPQTRLVCNDIYCPTSPLHIPSKYNPLPIQIQKLQWMQRTTRRESVAANGLRNTENASRVQLEIVFEIKVQRRTRRRSCLGRWRGWISLLIERVAREHRVDLSFIKSVNL